MKNILILLAGLFLIPITYYSYAASPGELNDDLGAFTFITESDDNANLSYVPGYGNLSNLEPEDITVGSAHEVGNTIASITEEPSPNLPEIDPIKEYKTNSSDWNIIPGTNPDLNQSFITNLPKE